MKTSLNLMTEQARRDAVFADCKRFWTKILTGTAVLLGLAGGSLWWQGSADSRRLSALERRHAPVQALQQECEQMESSIQTLSNAQQLVLQLVDTQPTVTLLGVLADAAADTKGRVFVQQFDLEQPSDAKDPRLAVLTGVGQNNKSVAQFAAALRESNLFIDVTLSSSDSNNTQSDTARSFRIECQL